jgi:hypothetical protein
MGEPRSAGSQPGRQLAEAIAAHLFLQMRRPRAVSADMLFEGFERSPRVLAEELLEPAKLALEVRVGTNLPGVALLTLAKLLTAIRLNQHCFPNVSGVPRVNKGTMMYAAAPRIDRPVGFSREAVNAGPTTTSVAADPSAWPDATADETVALSSCRPPQSEKCEPP